MAGAHRPVTFVAAPYEATASFVAGCGFGPDAIAERLAGLDPNDACHAVEAPADWTWVEAHPRTLCDPAAMRREVSRHVREALAAGRLPLVVGGEHTVTPAALAVWDDAAGVTVVQFDAHADLRADYEGTPWNHACAMRRAFERGHPLVQLGIRSALHEELQDVYGPAADGSSGLLMREATPTARLLTRSGLRSRGVEPALRGLGERVYVTIDLDALDPSCAPGVGTPEPDGLSYLELLDALDAVLDGRTLVGADVVELCPARDDGRTALLAARLLAWLADRG
ncbi:MAG: arginase family protein [Deltaproteobacteria bacterium]|nr:arginase family protein [Deltaproteobacteria bacterium]